MGSWKIRWASVLPAALWLAGIAEVGATPAAGATRVGTRARESCTILRRVDDTPAPPQSDALAGLLAHASPCPRDVFAFREALTSQGATLTTTFVGNRGFHNPGAGSFSVFETVTGDIAGVPVGEGQFFFGHFTAAAGDRLVADQEPARGALMIELIAWDPGKGLFNFYELIGDGRTGQWRYGGDSADILASLTFLHRQPDPARPKFPGTIRCAGCHMAGGPIMKELAAPHNDWWTSARPLPLGGRQADEALAAITANLADADRLARAVRAGTAQLLKSPGFQAAQARLTWQERLRPLFCPVEMNLASDPVPGDAGAAFVTLPTEFLADPRLATGRVTVARDLYANALARLGSRFPEIDRADADHAWLAPVKAASDVEAVRALVAQGLIDDEFVADVLAVDMGNPALSPARCSLLPLLPLTASGDWREAFAAKLAASPSPAAAELLSNMRDPRRDAAFHRRTAAALLDACETALTTEDGATDLARLLAQRRAEVFANEISKHPRGQILEPGFRVIFPHVTIPVTPGRLRLGTDCRVTTATR